MYEKSIRSIIPTILGGIVIVIIGVLLVNPYRAIFDRQIITGEVVRVGERFRNPDGGTVQQKMSFEILTGEETVFVNCDDTRCTTIEKGDTVKLNCFHQWHLVTADEWECRREE